MWSPSAGSGRATSLDSAVPVAPYGAAPYGGNGVRPSGGLGSRVAVQPHTLEVEEELLPAQVAREAAEAAVARDHAVAGDDERDRVRAARLADGASGAWLAQRLRDARVRADLAAGDLRDLAPDAGLEAVLGQHDRHARVRAAR